MVLAELLEPVKTVLSKLKTANFLEISTQVLEENLHKNGIFYSRSTIGKLIKGLGIPIIRKGRDLRLYDLSSWEGICIHYWIVEPPNGPYSTGKCKKCKEEKFFRNALDLGHPINWKEENEKRKIPNFEVEKLRMGNRWENDLRELGK